LTDLQLDDVFEGVGDSPICMAAAKIDNIISIFVEFVYYKATTPWKYKIKG
jgi:hypothetical protein